MTPENEIFPDGPLDPTVSSELCWISKAAHLLGKIIVVKTLLSTSENQLRGSNESLVESAFELHRAYKYH